MSTVCFCTDIARSSALKFVYYAACMRLAANGSKINNNITSADNRNNDTATTVSNCATPAATVSCFPPLQFMR